MSGINSWQLAQQLTLILPSHLHLLTALLGGWRLQDLSLATLDGQNGNVSLKHFVTGLSGPEWSCVGGAVYWAGGEAFLSPWGLARRWHG